MGDLFNNFGEGRKEEKIENIFDVVSFIAGGGDSMKFLNVGSLSNEEITAIFDDALKDIADTLFNVNASDAFSGTRSPNETALKLIENSSARDLDKSLEVCDKIVEESDNNTYRKIIAEDIRAAIRSYRKKRFKSGIVAEFKRRLGN